MVVWKLVGDKIGQNGTGALYCATKSEALGLLREYRQWCKEKGYRATDRGGCTRPEAVASEPVGAVVAARRT
jgi:hypothetical protein